MAVLWALASVACPHRAPSSRSSLETLRSSCSRFHFRARQSGNDCGSQKILTGKDVENVQFPQTNQRAPCSPNPCPGSAQALPLHQLSLPPSLSPHTVRSARWRSHVGIPVYPSSGNYIHASRLFSSVSHLTPLRGNSRGLS